MSIKLKFSMEKFSNNKLISSGVFANSNADRRSREAEAERIAIASEKVQAAKALEEAYAAEKIAEDARAKRKEAEQRAAYSEKTEYSLAQASG